MRSLNLTPPLTCSCRAGWSPERWPPARDTARGEREHWSRGMTARCGGRRCQRGFKRGTTPRTFRDARHYLVYLGQRRGLDGSRHCFDRGEIERVALVIEHEYSTFGEDLINSSRRAWRNWADLSPSSFVAKPATKESEEKEKPPRSGRPFAISSYRPAISRW